MVVGVFGRQDSWPGRLAQRGLVGEGVRFLLAGGVNTVVSLAVYWVLLLALPYAAAYSAGFLAGAVSGFVLSTRFVFRVPWSWRRLSLFLPTQAGSYLAGLALVAGFVELLGVSPPVAPLLTIVALLPFNFALSRLIVTYRRRPHAPHRERNGESVLSGDSVMAPTTDQRQSSDDQ